MCPLAFSRYPGPIIADKLFRRDFGRVQLTIVSPWPFHYDQTVRCNRMLSFYAKKSHNMLFTNTYITIISTYRVPSFQYASPYYKNIIIAFSLLTCPKHALIGDISFLSRHSHAVDRFHFFHLLCALAMA